MSLRNQPTEEEIERECCLWFKEPRKEDRPMTRSEFLEYVENVGKSLNNNLRVVAILVEK